MQSRMCVCVRVRMRMHVCMTDREKQWENDKEKYTDGKRIMVMCC